MGERSDWVMGIDLGGTKISCGVMDPGGKIALSRTIQSPSQDQELMVEALISLIRDMLDTSVKASLYPKAIGIGAAGFILQPEGIVLESPNIHWTQVELKRVVSDAIGLPVLVDNDANVAALGEKFAGICNGVDDFVYLTLGTGIGGGICIGGEIYRGHRGTAAEIGHMIVDPDGPMCGCGRRGCLEALASGTALEREAARLALKYPDSVLNYSRQEGTESIIGEAVAEAALAGDRAALEAFSYVSHYLGIAIVSLIHIFDPQLVVLGGGMARSGRLILDGVREVVQARGIPSCTEGTEVVLSSLGTDAGIIGAAVYAWEGIKASE